MTTPHSSEPTCEIFYMRSSLFVMKNESSVRPGTPRAYTTTNRQYIPRPGWSDFCRALSTSAASSSPFLDATRSFLPGFTAPAPEVLRSLSRCFSAPRPAVPSRGPVVAGESGGLLGCVWTGVFFLSSCMRNIYIVFSERKRSISCKGWFIDPVAYSSVCT